jgi:hypothetical protein
VVLFGGIEDSNIFFDATVGGRVPVDENNQQVAVNVARRVSSAGDL